MGEVIDEDEKTDRIERHSIGHHYTMMLGAGEYLDPTQYGNFGRFLNHSCDPNCETQKWDVLGEQRMVSEALFGFVFRATTNRRTHRRASSQNETFQKAKI